MAGGGCFSLVAFLDGRLRRTFVAAGLDRATLQVDNETTIHCWVPSGGRGRKPALLLLHGFGPTPTWQWHHQVAALSPHLDLYVPELVFFGESTTTSPERSEVFQAECMARLMRKLAVDRFCVAGTSYGGFVAYHVARLYPEMVERVIIASSAVNRRAGDDGEFLKKAGADDVVDVLLPRTADGLRSLLKLVFYRPPFFLPNFLSNDFIHTLFTEGRREKLQLLKAITLGKEGRCNLTPLPQEVLIMWGKFDQVFPLEKAYDLQKLIGENVKLEIMDKTSHVPQMEQPGKFNGVVLQFLLQARSDFHLDGLEKKKNGHDDNRSTTKNAFPSVEINAGTPASYVAGNV
ncbi:uncharacterized protein LOC116258494 [Nymphaea colorata]|nr:uncharacterized protein LOC116258494 [Nymphaea colorata]